MKPEDNNTFCYFPFSQLALKTWENGKGATSAAPCCNAIRPDNDDPLNLNNKVVTEKMMPQEIFYSAEMDQLRQDMLNGKRNSACKTCWQTEDTGAKSYRHWSSPPLHDYESFDPNSPKLQTLDLGLGENCNLRCRMCMPELSNKLRHDYKFFADNNIDTSDLFGWDWEGTKKCEPEKFNNWMQSNSHNEVEAFDMNEQWDNILENIHDLKTIKATGGETTLTSGFKEFIDHAIEVGASKNLELQFHTNATKFTDTLIEKMLQFKSINLSLSIDSVDVNYEYIRYPMKFSVLDKSVNNLVDKFAAVNKPITLDLTCVFSAYNAHYLEELLNWWEKTLLLQEHVNTSFYVDKMWPADKFTAAKYLGKKQKTEILDILYRIESRNIDKVEVGQIVEYIKENMDTEITDQNRLQMLKEVTAFDLSRGQFYGDFVHPSIVEYLETPIKD